ncbi:MAG: cytochrome c [Nitrospira sp.]|nr:cytochrome c [Nitrospira sp.]
MSFRAKIAFGIIAAFVLSGILTGVWFAYVFFQTGFSARAEPSALEVAVARQARYLAIPYVQRNRPNPIPLSPELLVDARRHFADHCATCHANNGSGKTTIGENVYPKVPDLRLADTQSMSDGELFFVIHNGIRFSAMPAWGKGSPDEDKESWKLVHFIRHLPQVTPEELRDMEHFNPKTAHSAESHRH